MYYTDKYAFKYDKISMHLSHPRLRVQPLRTSQVARVGTLGVIHVIPK